MFTAEVPVRTMLLLLGLVGCEADAAETPVAEPAPGAWVLAGGDVVGVGRVDVEIRDGQIAAVGVVDATLPRVDAAGRWIVPSFIDAHVHLVFAPRGEALVAGGIAGAVDWAAPLDRLRAPGGPSVVWAGPILTAPGGYPTQGWGADGYGLTCSDAATCAAAVDQVHSAGAAVVKIVVGGGGPDLPDEALRAIVDRAHELGLLVGAHALSDEYALRAGQVGADILVHAPRGRLSDATVAVWADRTVISTISAFGGTEATRQLRAAGTTVVYGTDFGNTSSTGISASEIRGLLDAGLDVAAIIEAGTATPARLFSLDDLGAIAVGKQASLVVLDANPLQEPLTLTHPAAVVSRGSIVAGELPEG
jgi:imidazolonepropionase-like amidohydrolase